MPTAPNSLTTTATFFSAPDLSAAFRSVVLPAPSAPVKTTKWCISRCSGEALDDEIQCGAHGGEADAIAIAGKHVALDERRGAGTRGCDVAGADRILFVAATRPRVTGHCNSDAGTR